MMPAIVVGVESAVERARRPITVPQPGPPARAIQ